MRTFVSNAKLSFVGLNTLTVFLDGLSHTLGVGP